MGYDNVYDNFYAWLAKSKSKSGPGKTILSELLENYNKGDNDASTNQYTLAYYQIEPQKFISALDFYESQSVGTKDALFVAQKILDKDLAVNRRNQQTIFAQSKASEN